MSKRKIRRQPKADRISLIDQADLACAHLLAIAELMQLATRIDISDRLLERAGALIRGETESLRQTLASLRKTWADEQD